MSRMTSRILWSWTIAVNLKKMKAKLYGLLFIFLTGYTFFQVLMGQT